MGSMLRRDDGQEAEREDNKILQQECKFSNVINSLPVKLGAGVSNTRNNNINKLLIYASNKYVST